LRPYLARDGNGENLRDGELIPICDIGGGTTDFSLLSAPLVYGEFHFERTAIGKRWIARILFCRFLRAERNVMASSTTDMARCRRMPLSTPNR
jgi:hypothetical protein